MQRNNDDPTTSTDIIEYEKNHLSSTLVKIQRAIEEAGALASKTERSYQDTKLYMTEYRGEIDPSEQYQNELFLGEVDRQSFQALSGKERLKKLLASPYFARVAFLPAGEDDQTIAYIGRFSFSFENQSIISDWRSPIAALFYDYEIGPAAYEAPSGSTEGELTGKRQIEIAQGKLVYAVDTGASVRDEMLQYELGKVSDEKMKTIIASIQSEQNKIIRDESSPTMIIQGVAGSGKTSIALHRVAYLLYRRKSHLNSDSVGILSPNKVFGDYISKVLPELGEEPIRELYLRDIFEHVLAGLVEIEDPRSLIDDCDQAWQERARYKGSLEFPEALQEYLTNAAGSIFTGQNLRYGKVIIGAEWLDQRFYAFDRLPIEERLSLIASDIYLELHSSLFNVGTSKMPTKRELKTALRRMLRAKDALSLYRRFYVDSGLKSLFVRPSKQSVEWEDASALVFCKGLFEGFEAYAGVRHLVIDEMQDLTPIQHRMMARLFPCEKTLLGDYYQLIDPGNAMDLASMQEIYDNAPVHTLVRSYRSTQEIMGLAKRVKDIPDLESIARNGEEPRLVACPNTQAVLDNLRGAIERFEVSGYRTLGILHKSEELARRYFELLKASHEITFISQDSASFEQGITLSSVKMVKGLEFDEVIILDADQSFYVNEDDRNLLYVAITRAMHRLTILYRNEPTCFLLS